MKYSIRSLPSAFSTHGVTRRTILASAAVSTALLSAGRIHAQARPEDTGVIKIGQSVDLTGPLADLGISMSEGGKAAFAEINSKGGINGRKITLTTLDDGYDVKRSQANVAGFVADPSFFALFNCMGTPMIEAIMPLVKESGIPLFAPFTGAMSARPAGLRNVLNIRASYPQEAERQLRHLSNLGLRKIAIAYQNNAFGKEVFAVAKEAAARLKLPLTMTASVENNASDATAAASRIASSSPEAVLLFLAGKPAVESIKALRLQTRGVLIYALSVIGSPNALKTLGNDATGVAISQVVPLPTAEVLPVVRDFQKAWKSLGTAQPLSHLALEGYINARVFAEVLGRAGKALSRASFIDSAWGLQRHDLGGFDINFTAPGQDASRFIEMTLVARDGRVIR